MRGSDLALRGKTVINLAAGKNLVGAFHHPLAVFADIETLDTLPANELRAGLQESIKAGIIRDHDLFSYIEAHSAAALAGNHESLQHIIAESQRAGGVAAYIDAEHAIDPSYARKCGVNIDELYISQPDTGEQALEIAEALVRSNAVDVIAVDSVAALVPRAELEGEMGDAQPGMQARLMSQALRKLTASISRSNTMVIFINQIRMKIGVMYGSPETTSGGNALKFYASIRLHIRSIGVIKERDEVVGNQTRVKVVKNKLAPPFKQVEFDIMYGEGVSKVGEIIDLGVKAGVVEKSGAWFSYDSQRIGQGRENAKQFLKQNPDIALRIETAIRQNAGLIADQILADPESGEDDEAAED